VSQTHPPYPLDGLCLQWCGSVTYGTTTPVRYYQSTALVLLWSSVPCRHRSRPLTELYGPAFRVLPKTGDEELEDWGKPGWERLRMICARSTSAWWRQDGTLWIDRHGVYLWMWLRPRLLGTGWYSQILDSTIIGRYVFVVTPIGIRYRLDCNHHMIDNHLEVCCAAVVSFEILRGIVLYIFRFRSIDYITMLHTSNVIGYWYC